MASLNDPSDTAGNLIAASQVTGTNVYNMAGDKLGDVYDVIINKQSGQVEYAIMSFGGFLGVGDTYHPLPWKALHYSLREGGFVVDVDKQRLEGAPSYCASDTTIWDDPAYGRRVNDYYGGLLV
jgi:hypothetical protein